MRLVTGYKDLEPGVHAQGRRPTRCFRSCGSLGGDGSTYSEHMKDARFTIPAPALLSRVVDMLDDVPMQDRDTNGDLYEYMLSKIATAGTNGQFRTQRHIIKLMVEMTAPTPEGAQCGSIRVPLDRLDPSSNARIRIGFELYPRSEANRPSLGTLVFMEGGPGYSTTSSRDWYLDLARNLTARRDVLLVDARGTGRSGALNCPALQSYTGDYLANARACAQKLGATATLYGSGNAAEDLVAVLDELGIQKVDLYGDSYGSFNAQTFAVRHPERVRSVTLDGAYPIAGLDPWYPTRPGRSPARSASPAVAPPRAARSLPTTPTTRSPRSPRPSTRTRSPAPRPTRTASSTRSRRPSTA